jgi:rod shape-determining protein MreB
VYSQSVRIGGDRFDEAIINFVRRTPRHADRRTTAERIKIEIGNAYPQAEVREMEVSGRNLAEGVPRMIAINTIRGAGSAARAARRHHQRGQARARADPAELCPTSPSAAIVLTGGGALLRDLDKLIRKIPACTLHVADDPLTCVARAAAGRWS